MKALFTLTITICCFCLSFSQKNYIKHTIEKGDNLTEISKKYNVTVKEIKELNPNLTSVLQLKTVIKIPQEENQNRKAESKKRIHDVQAKETLYGISKKYKVTIEDIKKANIALEKQALAMGMKLDIPADTNNNAQENQPEENSTKKEPKKKLAVFGENENQPNNIVYKTVLPKETKYGIAKQYGITVKELEEQNPEIINGLPVGYNLKINNPKATPQVTQEVITQVEKTNNEAPVEKTPDVEEKKKEIDTIEVTKQETNSDSVYVAKPIENRALADQLVQRASENLGVRYRTGGTSKAGFDCSGLMISTYGSLDIKLPRTSRDQSNFGYRISKSDAQAGDLIFFSTNGTGHVNHVGMVVEAIDGEIKFIHSSTHKGVIYSSTKESYYNRCFIKVNRVLNNKTDTE
jgi:peptidoglycan DL-endopeptidase LytE